MNMHRMYVSPSAEELRRRVTRSRVLQCTCSEGRPHTEGHLVVLEQNAHAARSGAFKHRTA